MDGSETEGSNVEPLIRRAKVSLTPSPLVVGSFLFTPPSLEKELCVAPLALGAILDYKGVEQDPGDITNSSNRGAEEYSSILANLIYQGAEDIYSKFRFRRIEDSSTRPQSGRTSSTKPGRRRTGGASIKPGSRPFIPFRAEFQVS
jgi:hypothetical protein